MRIRFLVLIVAFCGTVFAEDWALGGYTTKDVVEKTKEEIAAELEKIEESKSMAERKSGYFSGISLGGGMPVIQKLTVNKQRQVKHTLASYQFGFLAGHQSFFNASIGIREYLALDYAIGTGSIYRGNGTSIGAMKTTQQMFKSPRMSMGFLISRWAAMALAL